MSVLNIILLLLSFIQILSATTPRHCHNGTGRCYWIGTGHRDWKQARAACQSEGGDLAVMETKELHDYVTIGVLTYVKIKTLRFNCENFKIRLFF